MDIRIHIRCLPVEDGGCASGVILDAENLEPRQMALAPVGPAAASDRYRALLAGLELAHRSGGRTVLLAGLPEPLAEALTRGEPTDATCDPLIEQLFQRVMLTLLKFDAFRLGEAEPALEKIALEKATSLGGVQVEARAMPKPGFVLAIETAGQTACVAGCTAGDQFAFTDVTPAGCCVDAAAAALAELDSCSRCGARVSRQPHR